MDILKAATDWGRAEAFSISFFILFGILFIITGLGFWQLGKTEFARGFIYPISIAGIFMLVSGLGLFFSNKSRVASFESAYTEDASAFVISEIERVDKTIATYQTAAFKVFPAIAILGALLIMFMQKPVWQATGVAIVATMMVFTVIDSNAKARLENYKVELDAFTSNQ
ncbi:hypothetical protein [Flammeovirga sp. SJP92]|uniref:hypothetical protein n=1 Tax=Flammeovirga sp. SJP92 TaxID=1775430 RepID=UPI000789889B|nr:hypothetical protein [Flammeovirga sp. SJP92]KXX67053.1 hypothetical protein AVL50_29210 [Flammeovirga sp. SJP92]